MTYFPEPIFKNILCYAGPTLEQRQRQYKDLIVKELNYMVSEVNRHNETTDFGEYTEWLILSENLIDYFSRFFKLNTKGLNKTEIWEKHSYLIGTFTEWNY